MIAKRYLNLGSTPMSVNIMARSSTYAQTQEPEGCQLIEFPDRGFHCKSKRTRDRGYPWRTPDKVEHEGLLPLIKARSARSMIYIRNAIHKEKSIQDTQENVLR